MMDAETREALEIFVEETRDRVSVMDQALVELRSSGQDDISELVRLLFREAHSLKGSANLLGLSNLETLLHHFEDVLDRFRKGTLHPDAASVSVLRDTLQYLLQVMNNVKIIRLIDTSVFAGRLSQLANP